MKIDPVRLRVCFEPPETVEQIAFTRTLRLNKRRHGTRDRARAADPMGADCAGTAGQDALHYLLGLRPPRVIYDGGDHGDITVNGIACEVRTGRFARSADLPFEVGHGPKHEYTCMMWKRRKSVECYEFAGWVTAAEAQERWKYKVWIGPNMVVAQDDLNDPHDFMAWARGKDYVDDRPLRGQDIPVG